MAEMLQTPQNVAVTPGSGSPVRSTLWWIMLVLSLAIAVYATRFFFGSPSDKHFATYIVPLRFHIAGGIGALLSGPWQFVEKVRNRALAFHRWLGRFYLLSVALGSIAGLLMATVLMEGLPSHLGFGILAVLWFGTGLRAYQSALRGGVELHREWTIRNFALTLAAVTLRIWLPLMAFALHWPFRAAYITVAWLCWIPNLLVAEWIVRRIQLRSVRL